MDSPRSIGRRSPDSHRRRFLALAVATVTPLAGCTTDGGSTPSATATPDPGLRIDGNHLSASFPIELVDPDATDLDGHAPSEALLSSVHWHGDESHWHYAPIRVPAGGDRSVRVRFVDAQYQAIPMGEDDPYGLQVERAPGSSSDHFTFEVDEDVVRFRGQTSGTTAVVFRLVANGTDRWESPALDVEVTDADS